MTSPVALHRQESSHGYLRPHDRIEHQPVDPNQNPATAQGIICNYDASQYGENPGDRRQGQFQINTVGAGFATVTIAAAEHHLRSRSGLSYRLQGVGQHYTAQAYDWNDLTTPLVTIENDDPTSSAIHGACGLLGFSRQGDTGTVDITCDNYYAGPTDPRVRLPPARYPIPGTPAVDTRVPAQRWQNFLNPASTISFTANTWSTNVINASATRFTLNGVDVSSHLALSANGTNISGSLGSGVLTSNTLYSAQLVITDVSGTQSSTNTFWFDTFSDAYLLSSSVKTIEAEEYNYSSGTFQLDPIPVSGVDTNTVIVNGFGVGYYDLVGTPGIDFSNHNANADVSLCLFRTQDPVRTLNWGAIGIEDQNYTVTDGLAPGSDNVRSQHAAASLLEAVVFYTEPGEWLHYTRSFAPAFYTAYLRDASFGATSNELHLVTSDPTQPDQTTVKLGNFSIPNNMMRNNYLYVPLLDDTGAQPLFNLINTNTLRLLMAGTAGNDNRKTMLNYIMLVQAPMNVYSSGTVNGTYTLEASAAVNVATRQITVPVSGASRFYRINSNVPVSIKGVSVSGSTVTLHL